MEWEFFERGTHSKVGLISWPIFATSIVQNRTIFQAFWECFYLQIIVLSCKTFVFYNMFDILWWKISLKSITKTSLIKFYGHLWTSKKLFASRGLFEGGGLFLTGGLFKDLRYCDHLYSLNNDNFIFLGSTDPQWSTMSECPSVRPFECLSVTLYSSET